jgi:excisionase family DNA binding protein
MGSERSAANVRRLPDRSRTVETLDGLPLMLTVDETAVVLRISRTTAYKLVELHRATAGRSGLPHVRLGGRVLVRRVDLAEIVGVPTDAA